MGCGASSKSRYVAVSDGKAGAMEPVISSKAQAAQEKRKAQEAREAEKARHARDNLDYHSTMKFLLKVPLLQRLPADQHPMLATGCERVSFDAGDIIIKQGDVGTDFFILVDGEAAVLVEAGEGGAQAQVAVLSSGDYFGEKALLEDEPRAASIRAEGSVTALTLSRERFDALGLRDKLMFANRKAVCGGGGRVVKVKPPTVKSHEERCRLATALRANPYLSTMLDIARENAVIDAAWREDVAQGTCLIREGDLDADYFYMVEDGEFDVLVGGGFVENESEESERHAHLGQVVGRIQPGGSFGELALLYLVPRAATIRAATAASVWVVDRTNFKRILMQATESQLRSYVQMVEKVEVLAPLLKDEKRAVAKALVEMNFLSGEVIIKQGMGGNTLYILAEGEVAVVRDGVEQARLTADGPGGAPMFGERALLRNEPRAATVQVTSDVAKVLALDRDAFNLLLGPLQDIIDQHQAGARASCVQQEGSVVRFTSSARNCNHLRQIHKEDLSRVGLLGYGGFSAVELVEHVPTGDVYAMKILSKGYVEKCGMQESVINEKDILLMTNSDFIIKLYATYSAPQALYFLLEAALGGELFETYRRHHFFGSEHHARYYLAGTVFAFEHCHERRILYRDLKPENLLLTERGNVRLTDMGLAKFVIGKTFTTCGTPDYFAPEVINSSGHTNALDWWGLGVLLFELLTGKPPFVAAYPMLIYAKVLRGIDCIDFPPSCQNGAAELVRALLRAEPSDRLPMRPGGVKNLKSCAWFAGFDWEAMFKLELTPPYLPVVAHKFDLSNFSKSQKNEPPASLFKHKTTGKCEWDAGFATM